jgi:hypothetical protein
MHLQNRVIPLGEIVAISQRGMFTGNRGIIHDPVTKTLLSRRWTTKTWLVCSCEYRGRRRSVMAGRSWTELFFLDEAVALSAGHRPCFVCRREAAKLFRAAWAAAKGTPLPVAAAIEPCSRVRPPIAGITACRAAANSRFHRLPKTPRLLYSCAGRAWRSTPARAHSRHDVSIVRARAAGASCRASSA